MVFLSEKERKKQLKIVSAEVPAQTGLEQTVI
jgi:hypothetical protein